MGISGNIKSCAIDILQVYVPQNDYFTFSNLWSPNLNSSDIPSYREKSSPKLQTSKTLRLPEPLVAEIPDISNSALPNYWSPRHPQNSQIWGNTGRHTCRHPKVRALPNHRTPKLPNSRAPNPHEQLVAVHRNIQNFQPSRTTNRHVSRLTNLSALPHQ